MRITDSRLTRSRHDKESNPFFLKMEILFIAFFDKFTRVGGRITFLHVAKVVFFWRESEFPEAPLALVVARIWTVNGTDREILNKVEMSVQGMENLGRQSERLHLLKEKMENCVHIVLARL